MLSEIYCGSGMKLVLISADILRSPGEFLKTTDAYVHTIVE